MRPEARSNSPQYYIEHQAQVVDMPIETPKTLSRRFTTAPMMDWTDRHWRYFARLLSREALLYSEMVTTGALIHGDRSRFLDFNAEEHPVALQLGGHNAEELARCARFAEEWGYDEVNLNVGCPSDRVQNGRIGACLMGEADVVADGIKAMQDAVSIPVTIKHRIGITSRLIDMQGFDTIVAFMEQIAATGCSTFIVHARIGMLEGLSPKENREVPPLDYDFVYRLKQVFPHLEIILNGGIDSLEQCRTHLQQLDGVMLGRAAYQNPWLLSQVDSELFGDPATPSAPRWSNRRAVIEAMFPYIEAELAKGAQLKYITRHILGLFNGLPGARRFRRHLSEQGHRPEANLDTLIAALDLCPAATRPETGAPAL